MVSTVYHPDTHVEMFKPVGMATAVSISAINDLNQNFKVDMSVFLHWELDEFPQSRATKEVPRRLTEKPSWVPNIIFYNFDDITVIIEEYFQKGNYIFAFINWNIVIYEPFELETFPFDRQLLKVEFSVNNCILRDYNTSLGFCFDECPQPLGMDAYIWHNTT